MEITARDLWTVLHGMCFGAMFLMGFSGAIVGFYRIAASGRAAQLSNFEQKLFTAYLLVMAALGWAAVLSGAYIIYPWYRAVPPPGLADLQNFPQRLLLSSPTTSGWHDLGMEWKEHIAWVAPMTMTMAAYVFTKYRAGLSYFPALPKAVLSFTIIAFLAAGTAGWFGAFLNKYAPVRGGQVIVILHGEK